MRTVCTRPFLFIPVNNFEQLMQPNTRTIHWIPHDHFSPVVSFSPHVFIIPNYWTPNKRYSWFSVLIQPTIHLSFWIIGTDAVNILKQAYLSYVNASPSPLCTARIFNISHATDLGAQHGRECIKGYYTFKIKRLRWSRGSVLAFGTQVRGFTPGRSRRIFRAKKILSTPSFGGEVIKPSVPCRRFTACKRPLNVTCKSAFRQNYRTFLAHSSTFCRWVLSRGDTRGNAWWRKLERLTKIAQ